LTWFVGDAVLALRFELVAVGVPVAVLVEAGLDFSVRVGVGAAAVVPVAVGVAGGDSLAGEAGNRSGAHDSPPAAVAVLALAAPASMVTLTPEAAVSRTLPATNVTVTGRACAKRMKTPYQGCSSRYVTHWTSGAREGAPALLPG
jgi:hypothetical protein